MSCIVEQAAGGTPAVGELAAVSGAVAATEAEHAPTPVQLLAASVTGGAPAPTLSASAMGLPGDAGHKAAGARRCRHFSPRPLADTPGYAWHPSSAQPVHSRLARATQD